MKKPDPLAIAAGIVLIVAGVALLIASFFVAFLIIHGAIALILGIVILATLRQQEHIEPIKQHKSKN